jgi:hypothetical protein
MIEEPLSCTVSPLTKCNGATFVSDYATDAATTMQPLDLMTLSARVLERHKRNTVGNLSATYELHSPKRDATHNLAGEQLQQLHPPATVKSLANTGLDGESCNVSFAKGGNSATGKIRLLITQISEGYGGDDADFLAEYIDDVLREWSHDLEAALRCFSDLAVQASVNNRE